MNTERTPYYFPIRHKHVERRPIITHFCSVQTYAPASGPNKLSKPNPTPNSFTLAIISHKIPPSQPSQTLPRFPNNTQISTSHPDLLLFLIPSGANDPRNGHVPNSLAFPFRQIIITRRHEADEIGLVRDAWIVRLARFRQGRFGRRDGGEKTRGKGLGGTSMLWYILWRRWRWS